MSTAEAAGAVVYVACGPGVAMELMRVESDEPLQVIHRDKGHSVIDGSVACTAAQLAAQGGLEPVGYTETRDNSS